MQEIACKLLFKEWLESDEENMEYIDLEDGKSQRIHKDALVYRPSRTYTFPPSEGRGGFEFKEDGQFVRWTIGPNCGLESREGTWTVGKRQNIVIIRLNDVEFGPYCMEIVELTPETLKTRFT